MTRTRRTPWLMPLTLAWAMTAGLATPEARAQAPAAAEAPPAEGEGGGRVFDGYFATGILAFGVIFLVAKSARR